MKSYVYDPARDISSSFLNQVAATIAETGEVFVILRYVAAGGAKDYAFCRRYAEFQSLVEATAIGTDIEVFMKPQLPLRGVVTDTFISEVLTCIPEGAEYMLVSLECRSGSSLSVFGSMGDAHEELTTDLRVMMGTATAVAVGSGPHFNAPDSNELISASKGGIDGPR
jgi:hypothetical protein